MPKKMTENSKAVAARVCSVGEHNGEAGEPPPINPYRLLSPVSVSLAQERKAAAAEVKKTKEDEARRRKEEEEWSVGSRSNDKERLEAEKRVRPT